MFPSEFKENLLFAILHSAQLGMHKVEIRCIIRRCTQIFLWASGSQKVNRDLLNMKVQPIAQACPSSSSNLN